VNLAGLDARQLLWSVIAALRIHVAANGEDYQLWRAVVDRIAENRYQMRRTVFLLDDAHVMSGDVALVLQRLLALDPAATLPATIILSADVRATRRIDKSLLGNCDLRTELEPWSLDEVRQFLEIRLRGVGCERALFSPGASERLFRRAGGVPRVVIQLAELALLAAAGQSLSEVDEGTVEAVYQELLGHMTTPTASGGAMPMETNAAHRS
jgi:general secretion pathway protein A